MRRPLRVIQWGTGETGAQALRMILSSAGLDLVGVRSFTHARDGQSAASICGMAPETTSVTATRDPEVLLALEADCVVFMPRDPLVDPTADPRHYPEWVEDLMRILRSGKNVVTPLQSGMHWRQLQQGERLRRDFNAACAVGNTTLQFTGYDPGFLSDVLPTSLSSIASDLRQLRTTEVIDFAQYTGVSVLTSMGFGVDPDSAALGSASLLPNWGGSLWCVADALGVELQCIVPSVESVAATEDFSTPGGLQIAAGTVAALRWSLTGYVDNRPLLVAEHVSRVGSHVARDWPQIGIRGGFRIEIDGKPPLRLELPLGLNGGTGSSAGDAVLITAARCVNAIDAVVKAPAGYRTAGELPVLGGRHALYPPSHLGP